MSTTEKQESQKTVVAFVAGLLIGGLLVWMFSSAPEDESQEDDANTTNQAELVDTTNDEDRSSSPAQPSVTPPKADVTVPDDAAITVADQSAGSSVVLSQTTFPAASGWVVVREANGSGILGAARFETNIGLIPTRVELLRPTEAGKRYDVVFYTEDGDKTFNTAVDLEIDGVGATFEAN